MAKIIEEEKLLRYDIVNGKEVPVYSAKTETVITNTLTGAEYDSEEEMESDIANPDTDTAIDSIRRDVVITAPRLLTGSEMPE